MYHVYDGIVGCRNEPVESLEQCWTTQPNMRRRHNVLRFSFEVEKSSKHFYRTPPNPPSNAVCFSVH